MSLKNISASIGPVHSEEGEASDEDSTLYDTINSKKRDRSPSSDDTGDDPTDKRWWQCVLC